MKKFIERMKKFTEKYFIIITIITIIIIGLFVKYDNKTPLRDFMLDDSYKNPINKNKGK